MLNAEVWELWQTGVNMRQDVRIEDFEPGERGQGPPPKGFDLGCCLEFLDGVQVITRGGRIKKQNKNRP